MLGNNTWFIFSTSILCYLNREREKKNDFRTDPPACTTCTVVWFSSVGGSRPTYVHAFPLNEFQIGAETTIPRARGGLIDWGDIQSISTWSYFLRDIGFLASLRT